MQLTLGRRWILELRFSVSLRHQVEAACLSVRSSVQRRMREQDAMLRWERDKLAATMLSGWSHDFLRK